MDNKQKPNPFNSPTLQVLLDVKKALVQTGLHLYMIDDILEECTDPDSELRAECDKIFMAHNYNPKNAKFIQSSAYEGCPERYELPSDALKIFDFLERLQSPSGYVEFFKSQLVEVLHLTDTERKNLQKSLDILEQNGFIFPIYKPKRGSKLPCIYRINRAVTWAGKQEVDENKVSLRNKIKTLQPFEQKYTRMNKQIKLDNGKIVNCGYLELYKKPEQQTSEPETPTTNEKIESIVGSNEPDNNTEGETSLCSNNNNNNNAIENQYATTSEPPRKKRGRPRKQTTEPLFLQDDNIPFN